MSVNDEPELSCSSAAIGRVQHICAWRWRYGETAHSCAEMAFGEGSSIPFISCTVQTPSCIAVPALD